MSKQNPYNRVMLVEFNELSHQLINQWMKSGDLPNFSRLAAESTRYITEPDETEPRLMEPWIQWYSIHSGLPYKEHQVFHLTDGLKAKHQTMFSLASAAGKRVGIFGAMNQPSVHSPGGFYVADPWCSVEPAFPLDLQPYQQFIAQNVLEHSRNSDAKNRATAKDFLLFMAKNGLSGSTLTSVVNQLLSEKLRDSKNRWKRVEIMDRFALDVFLKLDQRTRPHLSAFFSNSTAHLQHTYWRHMDPEAFVVRPSRDDETRYRDAIKFGYVNMDRMLGKILDSLSPDTMLVFATALGQQPFLRKEATGGQIFYRLNSPEKFFEQLGLSGFKLLPVMTHQYKLEFSTVHDALAATGIIRGLTLNGSPLFVAHHRDQSHEILVGSLISSKIPASAKMVDKNQVAYDFHSTFYLIDGMKSGCHHPEGTLWLRNGIGRDAGRCSILDIFPTVLNTLSLKTPNDVLRNGRNLCEEVQLSHAA